MPKWRYHLVFCSHKKNNRDGASASAIPRPWVRAVRASVAVPLSLLVIASSSGAACANIHSPQGALDVAGILPGKYVFMARTASNIKAIASVMKQSIEVAALIQEGQPAGSVALSPVEAALSVASALPMNRAPAKVSITQLMSSRNLLWPVSGYIYSAFGAPRGKGKVHGAVDMVIKKGTPIAATADGVVSVTTNGEKRYRGYGKTVVIDHGEGVFTLYSHCDSILVKMGQRVKRGEFIATVGRTGRATTDHVHFEVRVAGKKLDPLKYLPSRPELVKAKSYKSKKT